MKYSVRASDKLYGIKGRLREDKESLAISRLGQFDFPKGYYIYVGSAKQNIRARIDRHIQLDERKRWHIDYLRPYLQVQAVQTYSSKEGECALFERLMKENAGTMPVKGFGSSDCRCFSHLFYSKAAIILSEYGK